MTDAAADRGAPDRIAAGNAAAAPPFRSVSATRLAAPPPSSRDEQSARPDENDRAGLRSGDRGAQFEREVEAADLARLEWRRHVERVAHEHQHIRPGFEDAAVGSVLVHAAAEEAEIVHEEGIVVQRLQSSGDDAEDGIAVAEVAAGEREGGGLSEFERDVEDGPAPAAAAHPGGRSLYARSAGRSAAAGDRTPADRPVHRARDGGPGAELT